MTVVIDFSGYYYQNQFIIKEYCKCRLFPYIATLSKTIVTEPPPISNDSFPNRGYSKYYAVCGINPKVGNYKIYQLRSKIKRTLESFNTVYVKNEEQYKLLTQFLKKNYINIIFLDKLGFDESREIKKRACEYHDDRANNYCASVTVDCMGKWLFNRRRSKHFYEPKVSKKQSVFLLNQSLTTRNVANRRNHLVVNFTGNYNSKKKYFVKEMSIYVLNTDGVVVDGQFLVYQPPDSSKNLHPVAIEDNNEKIWSTGNCSVKTIQSKIKLLFVLYTIKYIFVESLPMKRKLVKIIQNNSNDIICLSDYGYNYQDEQKVSPAEKCRYHNYPNFKNSECAESANRVMLHWMLKMQLYRQEIVESVKNFKKVALTQHDNILSEKSTGANINVQLRPIDNNSNEFYNLLSYVDVNTDEILDRPFSSQHSSGSMSFSDNKLQPGDTSAHSTVNNQEIHDSDFQIDDEVLDTFDIKNFDTSWLENELEPIDLDDVLSDDWSDEQTSKSDHTSELSDSDNDLFEKLLQSDSSEQSNDAMLDSHYKELEDFLL